MCSGSMRPEFSSTTFSWRVKNGDGASRAAGAAASSSTMASADDGVTPRTVDRARERRRAVRSRTVRGSRRGGRRRRRARVEDVLGQPVDDASEPNDRQPAASHTLALARTSPAGVRPCAAGAAGAGAPAARPDRGCRSQVPAPARRPRRSAAVHPPSMTTTGAMLQVPTQWAVSTETRPSLVAVQRDTERFDDAIDESAAPLM